jgi:hypothetical protein
MLGGRKMLQTGTYVRKPSSAWCVCAGAQTSDIIPGRSAEAHIPRGYPQVVDKFVDNHVNYLQKQIKSLTAIAQ